MAVSPTTLSGPRKEMSILESNQYLLSQLEESKQKLQDLREKYLTSKATAFSLANHLQKYECEEYKELIKSVLEEELQSEEGSVAEELRRGARLGKSDSLFQAQAQELTYLRQKIQEGRGVCYLFAQHVKNAVKSFESVLRSTGVTSYHGQRLCEQLTQGSKLAEHLARRLTTENHSKKDEDRQRLLALRFSREVPEEEANEILEDSLDEQYLTPSSHCDCQQPSSSNVILSNMQEATSAMGIASLGGMATKDEMWKLQQHLKETLFINDCLRESLEYHLSISDRGNDVCDLPKCDYSLKQGAPPASTGQPWVPLPSRVVEAVTSRRNIRASLLA
uniref:neuroblastoma breakpoint family member 6-like protein isoform X3 n=1 Tax=Ictidomys tridecemlineatus TaxID=43179 RepID=UPI001A9CE319|nr:neuroblastoma breakpoint family member 6-like protein isoform X3 [Ictidomys tridecemlineatus]XP_040143422.1 neuroblastoma breakpoint family member 6-like protein isoform X3 [Ictidomys tridecemlineatus]